jgi:hypothetical protein
MSVFIFSLRSHILIFKQNDPCGMQENLFAKAKQTKENSGCICQLIQGIKASAK